ncbi:ZYBA0S04-00276g1_1 [Zygosaccharomyces bailii CLIB 213]|uniref:ZYBA0S04-00276g1_1 n=1 Tax=Zygosaccharomyces bailii (strain CLIB 213 / ATCC 58445 / CBS 680 / BCRC 21525 / NBRC 1098 / NCYC 1416 / NRRL Y-2227) TaxID=1333698 RepID=A0A8J2T8K8_ZYGB2|nr:ZYBA0S04-00276g1_1 [Zygosaccharomyces bailii CLIB 213]
MKSTWFPKFVLAVLVVAFTVQAHDGMNMDDTEGLTRPDIKHAGSKTFHWLCTILFLLIMPSLVASLTFAGKIYSALVFQIVCGIYALLEAAVLRFPDGDGVENRTSRGTAWFLALFMWITIFFGGLASGTSVLVKNKKLQAFVSRTGETKLAYVHRALSFLLVLVGWVKVCLAPVAMFGFCRGKYTGQCLAHGIMGSSFILYGFIYTMVLVVPWIRNARTSYTQDYIDSWIMCIWGIVNTFTEHRWGREGWNMGDYQHTAMGILWWCGGLVGIFLSRGGRRTFVPSLMIVFTGWAMSEHTQKLIISTKVHYLFGLVLMCGGALRIVEIAFLLRDKRTLEKIQSFQYLPPFCLVCSGVLFMSANAEQLDLVLRLGADHSSYSLVIISGAFLVYLWILLCLEGYLHLAQMNQNGLFFQYSNVNDQNLETDFELDETTAVTPRNSGITDDLELQ